MKIDQLVDRDVLRSIDALVTAPCWKRVKAWTGRSWLRYNVWEDLRDEVDGPVWRVKRGVRHEGV